MWKSLLNSLKKMSLFVLILLDLFEILFFYLETLGISRVPREKMFFCSK